MLGKGFFIKEKLSNYRILSGGYNSRMKNNPQMALSVEERLIKAMKAFDTHTNYIYHKHVENKILRSQCLIDYHKEGENGLVFLRPKYWKVARMQGIKVTILMVIQTIFPKPYSLIKKLLKSA